MCCKYFSEVVCMYLAWNAANSLTSSGHERAECSISKVVSPCMYVCMFPLVCMYVCFHWYVCMFVLLFCVCVLCSSLGLISDIFSFLLATFLSVCPPPFQFPFDEVGLRPQVVWHIKTAFRADMDNVQLAREVMLIMLDTCIFHYTTRFVVGC